MAQGGIDKGISRRELGERGEALACRHLQEAGYLILARNFRTPFGELDLVASEAQTLVFVEVKTRRSDRCGTGVDAVTGAKQRKIVQMAQAYLAARHFDPWPTCRFDVVEVTISAHVPPAILHLSDAFRAS